MPGDGEGGALAALAGAGHALEAIRGVDPALDALTERVGTLAVEADDLAGELRRYGEAVDAPPGRLDEVEERLALFEKLKRKHGGSIEAVLAHGDACRERRDELAGAEEALEEATAALSAVRAELSDAAAELRAAREEAAARLAGAVVDVLSELAMEGATFEARVSPRGDSAGPAAGGGAGATAGGGAGATGVGAGVSALVIAFGKITISLLSAFAIVYFRSRFRASYSG